MRDSPSHRMRLLLLVFLVRSKLGAGKQAPQIKAKIYTGRSGASGSHREGCPLVPAGAMTVISCLLWGAGCMYARRCGARADVTATLAVARTP
jgi:hypothetical protein